MKNLKLTLMSMSEYAYGILNWLGNRTYRAWENKYYRINKLIFIIYMVYVTDLLTYNLISGRMLQKMWRKK